MKSTALRQNLLRDRQSKRSFCNMVAIEFHRKSWEHGERKRCSHKRRRNDLGTK